MVEKKKLSPKQHIRKANLEMVVTYGGHKRDFNKGSDTRIRAHARGTPTNNDRPRTIRKKSPKRRGHQ